MFSDEVLLARMAPGPGGRVARAQDHLLDRDVLGHAFDDQSGARHGLGDVVRGADLRGASQGGVVDEARGGVPAHALGQACGRALRAFGRDLGEDDVEPGHDEALRDAQSHPARADDGGQAGAVDGL